MTVFNTSNAEIWMCVNCGDQRVIFNCKCLSWPFPLRHAHVNAYMLWVNGHYKYFIFSARGSILESESDVL